MTINSYKKGKVGDLELVAALKKYFPDYRIKRIAGTEKSRATITGDVFSPDGILVRFHFENKNRKSLNIFETMEKTQDDAQNRIPIIRWHKPREQPLFIMREADLLNLLLELDGYLKEKDA